MTMSDERTRALLNARALLSDISKMTSTPDVDAFRQRADAVLRHYPDDGLIALIARRSSWLRWPCRAPDVLSQQAENESAMALATTVKTALRTNALTVSQLLDSLADVDPDRYVLFLTCSADEDGADEVCEVDIQETAWTHEQGRYFGQYEVWYPGEPEPRDVGYHDVTYETVRVIVLSDGPTNLRFRKPR
ncbi:BPSL0761 family protein [Burkholderia pseudomallei]|uniref:BPSL0761 family protein n=2 Tax=Burkholderia pseudomallei TaxID=28450 RepID=UPI0009759715